MNIMYDAQYVKINKMKIYRLDFLGNNFILFLGNHCFILFLVICRVIYIYIQCVNIECIYHRVFRLTIRLS